MTNKSEDLHFRYIGIAYAKHGEWFRPGEKPGDGRSDVLWLWTARELSRDKHRIYQLLSNDEE